MLRPPIKHTAGVHTSYRAALTEIVDRYGIDAIFVSSLVGHSLEAFRTGLPTLMISHDFYPFCPAFNITFGSVCRSCGPEDLGRCTRENPHHRFFRNVPPAAWTALRRDFVREVVANGVRIVAPSPSVRNHYLEFLPDLKPYFQVIPHGVRPFDAAPLPLEFKDGKRLRIVVLGSLAAHKGAALLDAIRQELLSFADLYLIGCGDEGQQFDRKGITLVPVYRRDELPDLLGSIRPDLGLLLSVVPETFSYTLQELFDLGIPALATRLGSFADRIQDGVNGFLVDPEPACVLERLRELAGHRELLEAVHRRLCESRPRLTEEMLADYEAALGMPDLSERAYFARDSGSPAPTASPTNFELMGKRADGNYELLARVLVQIRAGESISVRLPIPPRATSPSEWRLDVGDRPGFLLLFRMRLLDAAQETVWSWDSENGAVSGNPAHDMIWLGGSPGLLAYLSGGDPYFTLPFAGINGSRFREGGALEIDAAFPPTDQALRRMAAALFEKRPEGMKAENWESLLGSLTQLGGPRGTSNGGLQADRLLQHLTQARARVADLEQSLSWRITAPLRWGGGLWRFTGPLLRGGERMGNALRRGRPRNGRFQ